MAWIAAIISGVAGLGAAKSGSDAQKKALRRAGGNYTQAYNKAAEGLAPYGEIGRGGLYSLAELMGIEGYRTKEEQTYTDFLKTMPKAPTLGGHYSAKGDWLAGGPQRELLGDELASKLAPGTAMFGGAADAVHKKVFGRADKKERDSRAAAQRKYERDMAKYETDLATWNTRKAELEAAKNASLEKYDPMAALRRTPGYQFRYQQGLDSVSGNQAARGMSQSGRALKELTEYGQGYASNEYQNELARRSNLANMGMNVQNTLGNISIGQGSALANLGMQGAANTADYASSVNNAIQAGLGNYLMYQARNRNQNSTTTSSPTSSSFSLSTVPNLSDKFGKS